ncbi:MAG: CBS domain-containing protein [Desulfobaccales bacterium]
MTTKVYAHRETDSLQDIMAGLEARRFRAVLVTGEAGTPVGVVSKTDLILAYNHELPDTGLARTIMHAPVPACDQAKQYTLTAMIYHDLHRLFVYKKDPAHIVGILSLSDAARFRSVTCRASPIQVGLGWKF